MSGARREWQKELAPTAGCLDIARLAEELSSAEREHVAGCVRCQSERALFNEISGDGVTPEEARDVEWIASELHRRLDPPSNVIRFERGPRPLHALAAAAALVIVIGTAVWVDRREPSLDPSSSDPNVYRTSALELISPLGDLENAPEELRWAAVAEANRYEVRILEVDQTPVWTTETSAQHVSLPADVVARFLPGKTLLWTVTARRGNEVLASSRTQQFRVSVQVPQGAQR